MSCLLLFMHEMPCALVLALARAGNNMPAKMAIMAITTSNSMRVKAPRLAWRGVCCVFILMDKRNQWPLLDGGLGTHHRRLRPGFLFSFLYHSKVMNSALPPNMPVIAPSLWRLLIPSE